MATRTWSSTSGGWSTASLWSGGVVPVAGDTVVISGAADVSGVVIDGVTIGGVAGSAFSLLTTAAGPGNRGATLGAATQMSATGVNSSAQILNNLTLFTNAGAIKAAQGATIGISAWGPFLNPGAISATGGSTINIYGIPSATFVNTGTITIGGASAFREQSVGGGFVNAGMIAFTAGSGFTTQAAFGDAVGGAGTIAVTDSQVWFSQGSGGGQTIQLAGTSRIRLSAGELSGPNALQATIMGFQAGDTIDLGTAAIDAVALNGAVLSFLYKGSTVGSLRVASGYRLSDFALGSPVAGSGDALLTSTRASAPQALTVLGAVAGVATGDNANVAPFSSVYLSEPVVGATVTATVTLSAAANGTLSGGGGSYNAASGVYTLSGAAAAVQHAIDGLVFVPTKGQVAAGQTVLTSFTIAASDSAGGQSSNPLASVVTTAISTTPVVPVQVATSVTTSPTGGSTTVTTVALPVVVPVAVTSTTPVSTPILLTTAATPNANAPAVAAAVAVQVAADAAAAAAADANLITIDSGTVNTNAGGAVTVRMGTGAVTVNSNGRDTLFGGSGPDTVNTSGNAIIVGGTGAMTVNQTTGADIVFSGTGGLTFNGGSGTAIVVGFGNPITVNGGTGSGQYFGSGGSKITAGSGAQSVLVGSNGDQLFSTGGAGDLFGVIGPGNVLMSGTGSTGNDVFFGSAGTGTLTFITGSGNDLLGMGRGTNVVTLGTGHSTVFATGGSGATTINSGSGSADIGLGGAAANLIVVPGGTARTFNLFNFAAGADRVTLNGFSGNAAADALAGQRVVNGSAVLTLADQTTIALIGVTRAPTNLFG